MSEEGPSRSAWAELKHALFTPSPASLIGTFLVAALSLWMWTKAVTPEFVMRHGVSVAEPFDDYGYATVAAIRSARTPAQKPLIALLGGSVMRESIASPDDLKDFVRTHEGLDVEVRDFSTGAQNAVESSILADHLPEHFDGVVILLVGFPPLSNGRESLAKSLEGVRLGVTSRTTDDVMRELGFTIPARTGEYFWDNRPYIQSHFRLHKYLIRMWSGMPRIAHLFHGFPPLTDGGAAGAKNGAARPKRLDPKSVMARQANRIDGYDKNADLNLTIIGKMIDRLKTRGSVRFVLLESPAHPLGEAYITAARRKIQTERMQKFAAEHGATYLDVSAQAKLRPEEFVDYFHLNTIPAQCRYTEALAEALSPVFEDLMKTATPRAQGGDPWTEAQPRQCAH